MAEFLTWQEAWERAMDNIDPSNYSEFPRVSYRGEPISYIYILSDPDGEVRYVGVTRQPEIRFKAHLADKKNSRKVRWIQSLKESGQQPKMKVIKEVSLWTAGKEEAKCIKAYRKLYPDLTNAEFRFEYVPRSEAGQSDDDDYEIDPFFIDLED